MKQNYKSYVKCLPIMKKCNPPNQKQNENKINRYPVENINT